MGPTASTWPRRERSTRSGTPPRRARRALSRPHCGASGMGPTTASTGTSSACSAASMAVQLGARRRPRPPRSASCCVVTACLLVWGPRRPSLLRSSLLSRVGGVFHRGFPLLSQSLAAAICHTTSKDYSMVYMGYLRPMLYGCSTMTGVLYDQIYFDQPVPGIGAPQPVHPASFACSHPWLCGRRPRRNF